MVRLTVGTLAVTLMAGTLWVGIVVAGILWVGIFADGTLWVGTLVRWTLSVGTRCCELVVRGI